MTQKKPLTEQTLLKHINKLLAPDNKINMKRGIYSVRNLQTGKALIHLRDLQHLRDYHDYLVKEKEIADVRMRMGSNDISEPIGNYFQKLLDNLEDERNKLKERAGLPWQLR